jgi:hypothetical protein
LSSTPDFSRNGAYTMPYFFTICSLSGFLITSSKALNKMKPILKLYRGYADEQVNDVGHVFKPTNMKDYGLSSTNFKKCWISNQYVPY